MGRISASISGIERTLLNRLAEANSAIALSTLKLSTGKKINSPKDNPSAFFTLSNFESQLNVITAASANVTVANSIGSAAQVAVDSIRTQLYTIRTKALADVDQALTSTQRIVNQAAIDAAITQIDSLAKSDLDGIRVLDGSADFSYSGTDTSQVIDVKAFSLGGAASQTVSGTVTVAAEQATLTHTEGTGQISNNGTFTLTGSRGSASISVTNTEALTTVRDRINQEAHATGVTASVSGNDIIFTSIDYGSSETILISLTSGTFTTGSNSGVDAQATINSQSLTANGNQFTVASAGFHARVEFAGGFSGAFDTITISGSPPTFSLSTDINVETQLVVSGAQAIRLGGLSGTLDQLATGGSAAGLNTNSSLAVRIVDEALAELDLIEGQVDAFADVAVASSSAFLSDLATDVSDSIDAVNLVDTSEEAVRLAKNQALADNAVAALAILDSQRQNIVNLLKLQAGLL